MGIFLKICNLDIVDRPPLNQKDKCKLFSFASLAIHWPRLTIHQNRGYRWLSSYPCTSHSPTPAARIGYTQMFSPKVILKFVAFFGFWIQLNAKGSVFWSTISNCERWRTFMNSVHVWYWTKGIWFSVCQIFDSVSPRNVKGCYNASHVAQSSGGCPGGPYW